MPRDYAQSNAGGRQVRSRGLPGWVWMLVGVAIGFVAAAAYYISRPTADAVAQQNGDKGKPGAKKKITIPPKEPSRFAFYELLPNYEVVIPKETLKPAPRQEAAPEHGDAGKETFVIQVGSFQERKEAEAQKASLALLGIESRVEQVTIDNRQTWYRVRVGPERDPRRVEQVLAQLDDQGIKALVMRVPD